METEHYAADVPRLTRIVTPEKHAGKLIMNVKTRPHHAGLRWVEVLITTDTGEVIVLLAHNKVRVATTEERRTKIAEMEDLISGGLASAREAEPTDEQVREVVEQADERQVNEIASEYADRFDSVVIERPDEQGRVTITALLDDIEMRKTVVSPDGTVTPPLTPVERFTEEQS